MAATARLHFLDEAANLLTFASPTTAAQLRSERLKSTKEDLAKARVIKDGRICGGCGDSLIAGWNCCIKTKKRKRQERLNHDKGTKSMTLQCSRCNSFTTLDHARRTTGRFALQSPKAVESKKVVAEQALNHPTPSATTQPSASLDSGIRKRNRNKKSSLQSLLADRKIAEPKKGLDLMDFMKT
ncbi:hypothetical protein DOTSEDRAFT_47281 [Dothistroma septosporum NZE10]|uniref:Uncharacterized protein n=1 Tax=Dothistroma septosporum (strain NZE10 / CBS 128990) TaxID=675120 RepID=N1PFC5_DOTSN|nr:hypothetical protein DOTSEDRAFT_47281 [Dothistroma septosporum NZE10]